MKFKKNIKKVEANKHSDFWMPKRWIGKSVLNKYDSFSGDTKDFSPEDLSILAEFRNVISDIVYVLTRKNIPIKFMNSEQMGTGATDGQTVYISSDIHEHNFDSTCGLALHEASHIIKSNFEVFKDIQHYIPDELLKLAETKGIVGSGKRDVKVKKGPKKGKTVKLSYDAKKLLAEQSKQLLNWIEDRRIDNYITTNAPGYRGYYNALYNRFFWTDEVSKGLVSDALRTEDFASYMYRIINLINANRDLDALKGLKDINDIIGLNDISRLGSSTDAMKLTFKVMEEILKNIDPMDLEKMMDQVQDQIEQGEDTGNGSQGGGSGDGDGDGGDEWDQDLDLSDVTISSGGGGRPIPMDKLSDKQKKQLAEAIKKQKDFLNHDKMNDQKQGMSKQDQETLDRLNNGDISMEKVDTSSPVNDSKSKKGGRSQSFHSQYNGQKYNVMVFHKFDKKILSNDLFPFKHDYSYSRGRVNTNSEYQSYINSGLAKGRVLANKLQLRDDERLITYTRKNTGRIDRKLLSEAPYNEAIFSQSILEVYPNAQVHISIDGSGSMSGEKLGKCFELAIMVAVAAELTRKLDVMISIRGSGGSGGWGGSIPMIAILYDSRKDTTQKIKKLFPYLDYGGGTPEGLCYAAIQDKIEQSSGDKKVYFLNLSDGCPQFTGYSGNAAAHHTRHEVNKMRAKGVEILSYYIEEGSFDHSYGGVSQFEIMYGKDASYIDVQNINLVAKTLNKLFLTK